MLSGVCVDKHNVLSIGSVDVLEVIVSVEHFAIILCVLVHVVVELVSIGHDFGASLDLQSIRLKVLEGEVVVRGVSVCQPVLSEVYHSVVCACLCRVGIVHNRV